MHKGFEIELEMHQQAHGNRKCDYTLIKHPQQTMTIAHGAEEFPIFDLARDHALEEARAAIDKAS
jgi:hypothetical protein